MEVNMKKTQAVKWFFVLLLMCLFTLGYYTQQASAAEYSIEDIGKNTAHRSLVGVNLYYEDELLYYAHDIWKKNGSQWTYGYSNLNGELDEITRHMYKSDLIWMEDPENGKERFVIYMPNLFQKLGGTYEDYSVIIEHYFDNQRIHSYLETPFDTVDPNSKSISLMEVCKNRQSMLKVSSFSASSASYKYKLYKILQIKQNGDIQVASGNWSVTSTGSAYYNGNQYIIQSLPEITPNIEGYSCTFDGWYSAMNGGRKYEAGDAIERGSTIYPRWSKIPIAYPVKCIDIIGRDTSGMKLGESTWLQDYASVAKGAQAGCIPTESMYYEGMVYTGCTQRTVGVSGNVVYRYFDYAEYPVQIIDCVTLGPNTGKELLRTSRTGRYQTSVSGAVLGTDPEAGAYYPGYCYHQSTSTIVKTGGVVVYRYFVPVSYDIIFDGNGATSGTMDCLRGCWYDQAYSLIANAYRKEILLSFDLQAEDAVCDTRDKKVALPWSGWAESCSGGARYSNQESVRNLSSIGGTKRLYAVWNPVDITLPMVPKRMGYLFAGWSEDPTAVSGNTEFRLQEDTTLYAIWKPDIVNYHVEYYKEELDGSFQLTTQYDFRNYTGSSISIQETLPDYQGYYLDSGSSTLEGTVQGDGSLVLMAYYRRNSYQIQFDDLIGQIEFPVLQGVYEQTVQIPGDTPERKGYQFAGWTADPESTQVYCKPGDVYRIPNHNQTLYAIWQPDSYEIRFEGNVPEQDADPVLGKMSPLIAYYEKDVIIPACQWKRRGYEFTGWNSSADGTGIVYAAGQQIPTLQQEQEPAVTLYAMWRPVEGEIQYHCNVPVSSTSAGKGSMNNSEYRYGDPWKLQACAFELAGYDFVGWNTSADGTGESFCDRERMDRKMEKAGVQHLYAIWNPRKDTKFYLLLEKKTLDRQDTKLEMVAMEGETDQLVSDAIMTHYQNQGGEVTLQDFVKGFTVTNPEDLEQQVVTADGQTVITVHLERKKHTVRIVRDVSDQASTCYALHEILHEDTYRLPDSVQGVTVERYVDSHGNVYLPGEKIAVQEDSCFMMQHAVTYRVGKDIRVDYSSHDMPLVLEKPTEKEYYFSGWYWDETCRDFAGNAGDIIYITEDRNLFAKWTEKKITYQIQYDLGNHADIFFLEEPVGQYQYGEQAILPTAAQLWIQGYELIGWYESGDEHRTIWKSIPKDAYGDKKYIISLRKILEAKETPNPGNQKPDQPEPTPEDPKEEPKVDPGKTPSGFDGSSIQENPSELNIQDAKEKPTNPMGAGNSMDTSSVVTKKRIPIGIVKGSAANNRKKKFTRGTLTYQVLSSGKKTVKVIAADAGAERIRIPSSVSWKGKRYSVVQIHKKAFYRSIALKHITVGRQVRRIGKRAFYRCKKLRSVVFQGGKIQKIQKNAFAETSGKIRFSVPAKYQKKYLRSLKRSNLRNIRIR